MWVAATAAAVGVGDGDGGGDKIVPDPMATATAGPTGAGNRMAAPTGVAERTAGPTGPAKRTARQRRRWRPERDPWDSASEVRGTTGCAWE